MVCIIDDQERETGDDSFRGIQDLSFWGHGDPRRGPRGVPWGPQGTLGYPGVPWAILGNPGVPWGPHGSDDSNWLHDHMAPWPLGPMPPWGPGGAILGRPIGPWQNH